MSPNFVRQQLELDAHGRLFQSTAVPSLVLPHLHTFQVASMVLQNARLMISPHFNHVVYRVSRTRLKTRWFRPSKTTSMNSNIISLTFRTPGTPVLCGELSNGCYRSHIIIWCFHGAIILWFIDSTPSTNLWLWTWFSHQTRRRQICRPHKYRLLNF